MHYNNVYQQPITPFNPLQTATYIIHVDEQRGICGITPINMYDYFTCDDMEQYNTKLRTESTIIGETRYLYGAEMKDISYNEVLNLIKETRHE